MTSRSGTIDWWCVPRIDSGSAFGALLDPDRGGHMRLAPTTAYESSYAAAFDREDRDDIGRRAPLVGLLPLRIARVLRARGADRA